MKIKPAILVALAILLLTQCKREVITPAADEKAIFLEAARQFVQTAVPPSDIALLDWDRAIAYKKENVYQMVQVPLRGNTQPGQKALYLSYTNGRFSGNYFELINNTITTLSLDNTRKCVASLTANGQVRAYKVYENGIEQVDNTGMATSISVPPAYIYSYNHNLYYLIQLLGLGQGGGSGGQPGGQVPVASYLEPPADGGGSGGGGIAYFSAPVIELINRLNLYYEQAIWLQSHPALADELLAYLQMAANPNAATIGLGHLKRMMTDPGYLSFVEQYHIDYSNQPVWWENPTYLDPFGGIDFGDWAINYLLQHSTVNMATFQN
jgi:hypothetical protein